MVRRVSFQAGSSTPLHLFGVELEKVGDDFGFGHVGRKAVGGQHGAVVPKFAAFISSNNDAPNYGIMFGIRG